MDEHSDSAARDDGVTFAPVRLRGSRGPRIVAAIVVLTVGAMVVVKALDRQPALEVAQVAPGLDGPAAAAPVATARSSRPPPPRSPAAGPWAGKSAPIGELFDLDVRPAGSHLFIHGDVFSLAVTRVRVKLEDAAGHVAASRAVELPGGSTAFLIGAVPRFDVHFFLPDEVQGDGFVVSATALDDKGRALGTVEQRVPRASEGM